MKDKNGSSVAASLALVGIKVSPRTVMFWKKSQRIEAETWALCTYFKYYSIPEKPKFLEDTCTLPEHSSSDLLLDTSLAHP